MLEFTILESAKSMSLYLQPKGTEATVRLLVSSGRLASCIFEKIIPVADI